MITVHININGTCILARSATNVKDNKDGTCNYKTDCGTIIKHNPKEGAVSLAHKLLGCIKEIKQ